MDTEEQAQSSENSERIWPNGHQKALNALKRGLNFQQAAAAAGRTDDTLLDWRHKDPEYRAAIEAALSEGKFVKLRNAESVIAKAVREGEASEQVNAVQLQAAIQTVKALGRDVWGDKSETTVNGNLTVGTITWKVAQPNAGDGDQKP